MSSEKSRGYALGALAAMSYGLNPLFTLPLYHQGVGTDSVLMYRYLSAFVLLGAFMILRGKSLRISLKEAALVGGLGLLMALSSLFLFLSYRFMDAGVASTILFVYPVLVAVIMAVGFRERMSWTTAVSILMAFTGVALLCRGTNGVPLDWWGVTLVFLSSASYAVYIVGVNRSALRHMETEKLTFYVLIVGMLLFGVRLALSADWQPVPPNALAWSCAVALGLFPTVISLVAMAGAIRRIGSTPTAILGALEPVTALFFGVVVFGETFTPRIFTGVILILGAVTCIIAGDTLAFQIMRFAHHSPIASLPRLWRLRHRR